MGITTGSDDIHKKILVLIEANNPKEAIGLLIGYKLLERVEILLELVSENKDHSASYMGHRIDILRHQLEAILDSIVVQDESLLADLSDTQSNANLIHQNYLRRSHQDSGLFGVINEVLIYSVEEFSPQMSESPKIRVKGEVYSFEPILPIQMDDLLVPITILGAGILTPHLLSFQIAPYLQAIIDLQHIIDQIEAEPISEARIVSISQNSPISFQMEGVDRALSILRESVVPWRRENAKKISQLEITQRETEIARAKAEVAEIRAKTRQDAKLTDIEAEKQKQEVERLRLENEGLRIESERRKLELQREKIDMALRIIEQLSPNLDESDRIGFVAQLLKPLTILLESPLEIE